MKQESLIPKLEAGQRAVLFAERNTGILLLPTGERHVGQADCYRVFNSEDEAVAFAHAYLEQNPSIESSIRDENGNPVRLVRKESRGSG
jgi:hypothetical protein